MDVKAPCIISGTIIVTYCCFSGPISPLTIGCVHLMGIYDTDIYSDISQFYCIVLLKYLNLSEKNIHVFAYFIIVL